MRFDEILKTNSRKATHFEKKYFFQFCRFIKKFQAKQGYFFKFCVTHRKPELYVLAWK